jgi:hypothetical protein
MSTELERKLAEMQETIHYLRHYGSPDTLYFKLLGMLDEYEELVYQEGFKDGQLSTKDSKWPKWQSMDD